MVAGVSPYDFGAYLVPLILLVAVPSSALSIFISSSPANNNDDVAVVVARDTSKLNKENVKDQFEYEKQDNIRNKKVCVAPTFYLDSNKKIDYEWNNIIPEIKNLKSISKDSKENNDVNEVKIKKKSKKYKCYVGAGGMSEHFVCDDVNDAIGGSEDRTSDSSCLSNDNDEESKDEGYTDDFNNNNNNNIEKCKKNIETDTLKANYEVLPPSSTWPDYPLLVRKAPSSASYNVSQNKEKLEEFIRPIKIHFNSISDIASELHNKGTFFSFFIFYFLFWYFNSILIFDTVSIVI